MAESLMPCPMGCGCGLGTEDADVADCACDGPCCYDDLTEWANSEPAGFARWLTLLSAEAGDTDG